MKRSEQNICWRPEKFAPKQKYWAHPECRPEVLEKADRVLSTGQMIKEARITKATEIIIATETGLLHRLRQENPDKKFYPARAEAICQEMKNNLEKIYLALLEEKPEVIIDEETAAQARSAIDRDGSVCLLSLSWLESQVS